MAELSPLQRDVIIRLRLDPTQQKEGYAQARQIQLTANAQILALDAERQRIRGQLESQFTRESLRQAQERLQNTRTEIASTLGSIRGKSGEEKAILLQSLQAQREKFNSIKAEIDAQEQLRQKLIQLNVQVREQSALSKEARIAASALKQSGGSSLFDIFGNRRVLEGFTLGGAAQFVGLAGLATGGLPAILQTIGTHFVDAAFGATEFAHGLEIVSQKTGIGMRDLQVLNAIGKTTGLSLDDLVVATRRFSAALVGGGGGVEGFEGANARGAKVLAALGISTRDAQGNVRGMNEVMADLAVKFKEAPDGAEKARIAVELFGRSGLNLIPILNKGKDGLQELIDEFAPYSTDLSEAARAQEEWEKSTAKLDEAMKSLKSSLSGVIEFLAKLVDGLAVVVGQSVRADNQVREFARAAGLKNNEKLTPKGVQFFKFFEESATPIFEENIRTDRARASLAERGIKNPPREIVVFEILKAENERLRIAGKIDELLIQENEEAKKTTQEFSKAAAIAAGEREEVEKKLSAAREALAVARQEAEVRIEEARRRAEQGPGGFALTQITKVQGDLVRAEVVSRSLSGDELVKNLEEQKRLTAELAQLEAARQAAVIEHANAQKEADQIQDLQKQVELIDEIVQKSQQAPPDGLVSLIMFGSRGPNPSLGNQPIEFFTGPIAQINAAAEAGIAPIQKQLDDRKALIRALQDEVTARASNQNISDKDIEALAKLNTLLKEQQSLLKNLEKLTPFGRFASSLKEFGDIVGKFSGGLKGVFSEVFAGIEAIGAAMKQIQVLGGGTQLTPGGPVTGGSFFGGIGKIFSGLRGGSSAGLLGSLSGILGLAGLGAGFAGLASPLFGQQAFSSPGRGALSGALGAGLGAVGIGALVGVLTTAGAAGAGIGGQALAGITGAFTGPFAPLVFGLIGLASLFGVKKGKRSKSAQNITKQIQDQFKQITKAFNEGTAGLATTIQELQDLRAKAVAGIRGGKKGNSQQVQQEIDAIDQQLSQLKRQQKDILENFRSQIGLFSLPEGARDTASAIRDIAKSIKQAGEAGATSAEQIAFLNGAMDALKTKTAGGLRTDQLDTLNLLRQSIDLEKQRVDLESSFQDSVLNVRRSLGLAPALTPEQQAAKQLKDLKKQRDEQLAQIDEQAKILKAQLDGRAELFGLSLKDLDVSTARAAILDRQLVLERQITAETIARIQAQQALFAQLAAGHIPALPNDVLPPGFSFPGGSAYTFQPGSVVINFPTSPTNPEDAAEMLRRAFLRINADRSFGLQ